jgi:hypothetical protein
VKNLTEFKQYIKDVVFLAENDVGFKDHEDGKRVIISQEIREFADVQLYNIVSKKRDRKINIAITAVDKCTPAIRRNRRGLGS